MPRKSGFDLMYQEAPFLDFDCVVFPTEACDRIRPSRLFTYGALKRGMDLVISSVALVVLSPLFLVVSIIVKIDSPGPVIFKQKRTGKGGKEFEMFKFRSMVVDNDVHDQSCDDKYTGFGKFIRKTSIDELPQIANVFLGQMSLIGPRPWIPEYWENMNQRERGRAQVRPGITGLAAAKGRNGLSVFERIEYDLEYVRNYSLKQDVKVVFLTVKMVLSSKEAEAGKKRLYSDIDELKRENQNPKSATGLTLQEMATKVL